MIVKKWAADTNLEVPKPEVPPAADYSVQKTVGLHVMNFGDMSCDQMSPGVRLSALLFFGCAP